jgi:hypothetical protein
LKGDAGDIFEAWKFFTWCEALEWKFLPAAGGLEDQDDILMENLFQIKLVVNRARELKNG